MRWWNEPRYVSDAGLRCYFSERDRGGPARLECYRRLLKQTGNARRAAETGFVAAVVASLRRAAQFVLLPRSGWRGQGALGPELAGR
jgi:hypothetical protein